jgi:hypothetical protein
MTFQEARRHLKKMIKPKPELVENECYELPGCGIEKQIDMAQEKGPGEHKFFYMKTEKVKIAKDGKPTDVDIVLLSEKLNISG